MDPDFNGKIDEVDINFILSVLAKKYRFLQALPSPKVDGCEITVDATLLDDESKLVTDGITTQVKLEVGTKLNAGKDGLVVQVGKEHDKSNDGVILQMEKEQNRWCFPVQVSRSQSGGFAIWTAC